MLRQYFEIISYFLFANLCIFCLLMISKMIFGIIVLFGGVGCWHLSQIWQLVLSQFFREKFELWKQRQVCFIFTSLYSSVVALFVMVSPTPLRRLLFKFCEYSLMYHGSYPVSWIAYNGSEIFKRLWPPGNNILMIFNLFQSDENYRILAKVVFLR